MDAIARNPIAGKIIANAILGDNLVQSTVNVIIAIIVINQ